MLAPSNFAWPKAQGSAYAQPVPKSPETRRIRHLQPFVIPSPTAQSGLPYLCHLAVSPSKSCRSLTSNAGFAVREQLERAKNGP
jgi:hypothetical protein